MAYTHQHQLIMLLGPSSSCLRIGNNSVKKLAVIKSVIIKSFHCTKLQLSISREWMLFF